MWKVLIIPFLPHNHSKVYKIHGPTFKVSLDSILLLVFVYQDVDDMFCFFQKSIFVYDNPFMHSNKNMALIIESVRLSPCWLRSSVDHSLHCWNSCMQLKIHRVLVNMNFKVRRIAAAIKFVISILNLAPNSKLFLVILYWSLSLHFLSNTL